MGCAASRPDRFDDFAEPVLTDIVVSTAGEYVLSAASTAPTDHAAVHAARRRFKVAYNVLVNREQDLTDDAEAYMFARCVLNAHRAGVVFTDAPLHMLRDGLHRPFVPPPRRMSV